MLLICSTHARTHPCTAGFACLAAQAARAQNVEHGGARQSQRKNACRLRPHAHLYVARVSLMTRPSCRRTWGPEACSSSILRGQQVAAAAAGISGGSLVLAMCAPTWSPSFRQASRQVHGGSRKTAGVWCQAAGTSGATPRVERAARGPSWTPFAFHGPVHILPNYYITDEAATVACPLSLPTLSCTWRCRLLLRAAR